MVAPPLSCAHFLARNCVVPNVDTSLALSVAPTVCTTRCDAFAVFSRALGPGTIARHAIPEGGDHELALMTAFTNRYTKVSGTYLCSEPSVAAVVIKGLAENKATLGAPLCPCRYFFFSTFFFLCKNDLFFYKPFRFVAACPIF